MEQECFGRVDTKEPRPEVTEKSFLQKAYEVLWHISSVRERAENERLEARRYRDPRERDPDYNRHLRELEGDIRDHEPPFRMGDYHEGGGSRWDKWAMPGLVTLAVTGIIGNVVQSMTVSALRQEVADLQKEVDHIEKIIEPRYRGG
jgi:hypothetical protein